MFESGTSYPCAIADGTDEGLQGGFDWCAEHMDEGHKLTLYVAVKSSSSNSPLVNEWLRRYSDVELTTARGFPMVSRGPVLALWPSAQGLGKLLDRRGALTALCVASWNHTEVGPWVAAARPEILDSAQVEWGSAPQMQMHPDVEEEMLAVTRLINHNNTISGGFEKSVVVKALLRLHDAGHSLDGPQLQGWALARGWGGDNPAELASYATEINAGKRPRTI